MNNLSNKERYELDELVEQKRDMYQLGMGPLGDGIVRLATKLGIWMLYFPKETDSNHKPLSAMFLSSAEKNGDVLSFIGVNTAQPFDLQLFSIAHELYHFWEKKKDFYLCRDLENLKELRESKANQFAASFLLPSPTLKQLIREKNDYELNLNNWKLSKLLRFIATIHLEYKLPYRSIVRRLEEVDALTDSKLFEALWEQNERDLSSLYYKIAMSFDSDLFTLLNHKTKRIGADAQLLNYLMENFEKSLIGEDQLADELFLFGRKLDDYGLAKADPDVMEALFLELEEGHSHDD